LLCQSSVFIFGPSGPRFTESKFVLSLARFCDIEPLQAVEVNDVSSYFDFTLTRVFGDEISRKHRVKLLFWPGVLGVKHLCQQEQKGMDAFLSDLGNLLVVQQIVVQVERCDGRASAALAARRAMGVNVDGTVSIKRQQLGRPFQMQQTVITLAVPRTFQFEDA
jgi:hypothetical protein